MAGITSDLAKKSGDPPRGSPDDFRRDNVAGPHGISLSTSMYYFVNSNCANSTSENDSLFMTVMYFKYITVITDSKITESLSKKDLYLVKRLLKNETAEG